MSTSPTEPRRARSEAKGGRAFAGAAPILRPARTPQHMNVVRILFREYERWLGVDLCFQGFEEELKTLPGAYAPPGGELLLAWVGDQAAGIVGVRPLDSGTCEMKRLYARPQFRGHGVGTLLAEGIMAWSREAGYAAMRLDTLPERMPAASHLYARLGFRPIPAYYYNPLAGAAYLEASLADS